MNLTPMKKLGQIKDSLVKHIVMKNHRPYEQILRQLKTHGDIWMVSQGEYLSWWLERENATLTVTVSDNLCQVYTSLENAVIDQYPGGFLESPIVVCPETRFSGEIWLTIDRNLEKKELLIELLKREGILYYRVADEGTFVLSQEELGPLLDDIYTKLSQRDMLYEDDISALRQIVVNKLAAHNLPLLRIWYHPRVEGVVMKAVFSPRYDVDRAITNLAHIRALENKYGVSSTLYLRAFGPFYSDQAIKKLASQPWCSELAVHGEFITNSCQFGDEYKAALAEKQHLENLVGRSIWGVCMHGGELTSNTSQNTSDVIQKAGFVYNTTSRLHYYFPFKQIVNGKLSKSYCLVHDLGDIKISTNRDYGKTFYEQTIAKMDEIYKRNGVFVLMLHPVYFGFFAYLLNPKNWVPLIRFSMRYFKQHFHLGFKYRSYLHFTTFGKVKGGDA